MQYRGTLNLAVFIHPPTALQLPAASLLRLIKPLYGLADDGDHRFRTQRYHLEGKMHMDQTLTDPVFLRCTEVNLSGQTNTLVDDMIKSGSEEFPKFSKSTAEEFESKPT